MPQRFQQDLYFLPIGGTAMAPLAALLAQMGHRVSGSDTPLYPPMSTLLERLGIPVLPGFRPENVPEKADRVIIGNAVSRGNLEVQEVLRRSLPYLSMPQAVHDYLLPGRRSVVICGTHGKTTSAALLAWLLYDAGRDPGFLIGGELVNFGCGYRLGAGGEFVLEGDEYNTAFFDRGAKFLHYEPRWLAINHIEFDHADVYPDLASVVEAFRQGVRLVPEEGVVVANLEDRNVASVAADSCARLLPVGLSESPTGYFPARVVEGPEGTEFDLVEQGDVLGRLALPLWGRHNLRNALVASALARSLGLSLGEIARAMPRFRSVRRRLEVRGEKNGILIIDDFAHHPTAVGETLSAARSRWPGRRLWAVFEPRSNTAGRKFFEEAYRSAFGKADAVVLAPIFHASRLAPGELLDRETLVAEMKGKRIAAFAPESIDQIAELLRRETREGDVLLLMSSGAFGGLHERLLAEL